MAEVLSALGGQTEAAGASRWPAAMSLELRGGGGAAAQQEEEQGRQGSTLRGGQSQKEPVLDRRKPTRLPRPWDSPGKNTGVGCHFLLHLRRIHGTEEGPQGRESELRGNCSDQVGGAGTEGER